MDGGNEFEWDWFAEAAAVLAQSRQQVTWALDITASDRLRSTPADSQSQNSMIDQNRNFNSSTLEILHAREAERILLASLLHDQVQPLILSARFKLASLNRQMPEGVTFVQEADSLLAQALGACRSLSTELSALELAPDGLIPALEILAEQYRCRFNLEISLRLPKQMLRWPSKTEIVLYQSVRELLLNAVKHAQSPKIEITVAAGKTSTTVRVRDWGIGFGCNEQRRNPGVSTGTGLKRIRQLLEHVDGRLIVATMPTNGTSFIIHISASGAPAVKES